MNMRFPLLAITAITVCIGSSARLSAQDEQKEKPKEKAPTKIAVVDLKVVFAEYTRARTLRDELEKAAKPFQDKASKLRSEIKTYEVELAKGSINTATKHRYEDAIRKHKFELEELTVEFNRRLIRSHEKNVETILKEVSMTVNAVANAYEFQLVLPHGEPDYTGPSLDRPRPNLDERLFGHVIEGQFEPARKRDIRAPLYVHGSIDITPIVVTTLNRWASDGKKQPGDPVRQER